MAWNVLPAWLPSFGTLNGRPSTESGFTTMVELERLNDEIQMLAGLHNDLADLIKKRKITLFQRMLIGRTEEYNYKNLGSYRQFPGGFYMIDRKLLMVVS